MDNLAIPLYFSDMDDDLVFLSGAALPRCTTDMAKHWIGYQTLQLMTSGSLDVSYDQRTHQLSGAWFWSAFPGPFISFARASSCPSWNHRYVAFTGSRVGRWIADGIFPVWPQRAIQAHRHADEFDEVLTMMSRNDRWGRRRSINLLERILLELADARSEQTANEPWLTRIFDALADTGEGYAASRLAKQVGMSEVTLRRRFRAATGQSLHAYAITLRLAEARRLLADSNDSIQSIAGRLGYSDVFFFSKQFRKHVGVPPAAFRASKSAV